MAGATVGGSGAPGAPPFWPTDLGRSWWWHSRASPSFPPLGPPIHPCTCPPRPSNPPVHLPAATTRTAKFIQASWEGRPIQPRQPYQPHPSDKGRRAGRAAGRAIGEQRLSPPPSPRSPCTHSRRDARPAPVRWTHAPSGSDSDGGLVPPRRAAPPRRLAPTGRSGGELGVGRGGEGGRQARGRREAPWRGGVGGPGSRGGHGTPAGELCAPLRRPDAR